MARNLKTCVAVMWSVVILPALGVAATSLDGTQWKMREGNPIFGKTNILKFEDGKFKSDKGYYSGFTSTPYEFRQESDKATWTALQTNSDGEKMNWVGALASDKMTGSYSVTDARGKVATFTWTARQVKKSP